MINKKKLALFIPLFLSVLCVTASCTFPKENTEVSGMTDPGSDSAPASSDVSDNSSEPCENAPEEQAGLNEHDGPEEHGGLRVENGRLLDESGEKLQLRGMSTHGIGWYPNYINAGAMKSVREAGGNVMRVAMYTEADSGYLSEPESNMNMVLQAIENARAMDMYIIVDWHILDDGDPNKYLDKAITFFDAVASRYPGDPAILYEVCNEPNGVSWEDIKKYGYAICPVIRQYSPQAVIILGTPEFSYDISSPLNEPFEQENILYSYHFYAGMHKSFSGLENAVREGLPVIVSEWGIDKDTNGEPQLETAESFADYINEEGISWCAWSLCNKDEVFSVLRPDCNKLGSWQESDLTEVGKLIFEKMEGKAE